MKKSFLKSFIMMMALAAPIILTSCGDDDDQPYVPETKYSTVSVNYTLDLSEDYFDLWDIQVTYTSMGGEVKTEIIEENWDMTYNYAEGVEVPGEFVFNVMALPKDPVATLDPEKLYHLEKSHRFLATGIKTDGSRDIVGGSGSAVSSKQTVKGEKLENQVNKIFKITEGTYTVKL